MKKAPRLAILGLLPGLLFAGACCGAPLPANDLDGRQGYLSRPCGFDMDRDGVFGEAEDCHVCDGRTTDPDHDGAAEDLFYVDCQKGSDTPTCGTPAAPCATLEYTFAHRADGPAGKNQSQGAEDIVCFRGTCRPQELEPRFGGAPGTYTLPKRGNEAIAFQLPKQPAMLAGWDSDADGDYPPHDKDDLAVLYGGMEDLSPYPLSAAERGRTQGGGGSPLQLPAEKAPSHPGSGGEVLSASNPRPGAEGGNPPPEKILFSPPSPERRGGQGGEDPSASNPRPGAEGGNPPPEKILFSPPSPERRVGQGSEVPSASNPRPGAEGGNPPPEKILFSPPSPERRGGQGGEDPAPSKGLTYALRLGVPASYMEFAHFEVRDYGRHSGDEESGFVAFGSKSRDRSGGHRADAFFFHDLRLAGINAGQPAQSHRIVFGYFTRATRFHHLLFRNLEIAAAGGFLVRGSGPDRPGTEAEGGNDGPFRWQNVSLTARGCNHSDPACVAGGGSAFIGWKLWGYIDGIEILDSVFDANVGAWEPKPDGNGGALFVNATQCSRGWTIRNNRILDFKVALIAQGGNGAYCGYDQPGTPPRKIPRPTGAILFADNHFWNTYQPWRSGDLLVQLKGGDDQNRTLGEVTIENNLLASSDGFDACIRIDVGNAGGPPPGKISILGNTCWGSRAQGRATGLWIGSAKAPPFVQENVVLRRNVFAGFGPEDLNLRFDSVPKALDAGGNLFDPDAPFELGGRKLPSLEALAEALGKEGPALSSKSCEPAFEDPARGRFRLAAGPAAAACRVPP